ncbi:MAG: hypothetical protein KC933_32600 [Myxococcales bacterium]|nr:hypothetical protein [Myxococcales bacterium]MCB9649869.1 hypothetical protein [Deltaproteobacteria bacterium]
MNVTNSTAMDTTSSLGNWNNQSFREKFGDSLFKTDNQRRLAEYADADMAKVQMGVSRRLQAADNRIQDTKDLDAGSRLGRPRTLSRVADVASSFAPISGAALKAMHLRA